MGTALAPVANSQIGCKCCGSAAQLLGVVDFHKNCEDRRLPSKPLSGIPIYYYCCARCGLIFTTAFDEFTSEDFRTHIYNAGYSSVDPDYLQARPAAFAQLVAGLFAASRGISVLDYGGGKGVFADRLRADGFTDVTTYDPFVSEHENRPDRKFDLVTSFEVLEHAHRPAATLDDLVTLMKPEGLLLFTTLLIPPDIGALGVSWWYIAPRNGHVTLYSEVALRSLLQARGLRFATKDGNLHIAFRSVPAFARHCING